MATTVNEVGRVRTGGKEMEDISAKNIELEHLDKEFQELLQHISGDENLEKYRAEYAKLYKTFCNSFENEKRLVKQCKDLNDMIMTNAASIKAALEMSQEDSNTIKRLRKEIEKAWQFVEKAKDKEERSKKMVQDLKSEIIKLNSIVEQGAAQSLGPENNVHELIKTRDELLKLNEEKSNKLTILGTELLQNLETYKLVKQTIQETGIKQDVLKEIYNRIM